MYVILSLFCLGNYDFSQPYCRTGARSKRRRWTMHPPEPRSLKWQAWKLHDVRDIEKYGLHFQFYFHNPNSAMWKPRSLCRLVPKSISIDTWPHYTVIFKVDLLWASLEKTIVMHLIVNSNVFYISFAPNKSISVCVFSRIKRIGIIVALSNLAYL